MTSLASVLKNEIRDNGYLTIERYFDLCLGHPAHGYYVTRDPFGKAGDFITAPEITQIFGELIGAWLADLWLKAGKPDFTLLECGPGRGNLMADILRGTKNVPGFHDALDLTLMEISPVLKKKQSDVLQMASPNWISSLSDVPSDKPIFAVANEFIDALGVRQLVKRQDGYKEKVITLTGDNEFTFNEVDAEQDLIDYIPGEAAEGDVFEISPARHNWLMTLGRILKKQGGAGLFIDYGYINPQIGESFQAVKNHNYVDPLEYPGEADLTAHVDFSIFQGVAKETGLKAYGPVTQARFLKTLGIDIRARALMAGLTPDRAEKIEHDVTRITSSGEMGELFKVCALTSQNFLSPEGFA